MKPDKRTRRGTIFLSLCIMLSFFSGCSENNTEEDLFPDSGSLYETEINEQFDQSSDTVEDLWRETTVEEIQEIFGETLKIPEGVQKPVLRFMDREQLAELTFTKDGFAWTIRLKSAEEPEDISGLNYDWDYKSDIIKLSAHIDYAEENNGSGGKEVEYQESRYAHDGVYIGAALWYSKAEGLQYSTSYMGGDYTSYTIAGEVIEDLWPWTQELSNESEWNSEELLYEEKNISWPFGEKPIDAVLTEEDLSRQYAEMETIFNLNKEESIVYSPLQFETMIDALAEGANESTREKVENYTGKCIEDEKVFIRSLRYSIPSMIVMRGFIRYQGKLQDTNASELDLISSSAYGISYQPVNSDDKWIEEAMVSEISELTNGEFDNLEFATLPNEKSIIGDGISYFHLKWAEPYDISQVGQMNFTNVFGETEKTLGMVSTESCYMENETAKGFMKYFEGERFAFVGILPKEEGNVSVEDLHIEELMASAQTKNVLTVIPEIIINETLDVTSAMEKIGIEGLLDDEAMEQIQDETFTVSTINLSTDLRIDPAWEQPVSPESISEEQLRISNENELSIVLDRPFVFMILDTKTGEIMFCGIIRSME